MRDRPVTLLLINGLLIDGTGREPAPRSGVVIEAGRVVQVGSADRLRTARDARVIDVEGRTIMPGLIDCHTHLAYHRSEPDVWAQDARQSIEANTLAAAENARSVLAAGFTSIGDGGCRGAIAVAIRDAVARGQIPGPRVVAAGPILSGPAGLYDFVPPWLRLESRTALATIVSGPDQVRRAVVDQVKAGVDWIKVAASGVAGSRYSSALTDDLGREEIRAAVVEAKRFGKLVHAHAHSQSGIRAAVEAGVVSLHSGEYADEETLVMMRDAGVVFSPTLAWLQARYIPPGSPPADARVRGECHHAYVAAKQTVAMARGLGVKVAIGTDAAHRFPHVPDGVIEMEYFVALGYSPLETITAATQTAALAIGRAADLGTIEPGKRADILVVEGDPAADIRILRDKRNLWRAFQDGKSVDLAADRGILGDDFRVADWFNRGLDAA
ncbi:MAG: amidohydrolase family protein [Alphaproteobacteria bacterium]|nr:amidohydrolase family protein [Alphaproteobacteria bacterium]